MIYFIFLQGRAFHQMPPDFPCFLQELSTDQGEDSDFLPFLVDVQRAVVFCTGVKFTPCHS